MCNVCENTPDSLQFYKGNGCAAHFEVLGVQLEYVFVCDQYRPLLGLSFVVHLDHKHIN